MWLNQDNFLGCGIDWFTTTAVDADTANLLLIATDRILWTERRRDFLVKPWRSSGYSGWRCGRLEWGIRDDGAIVRLSGALADLEWWSLYQITQRCSRIDLQLMFMLGDQVNEALADMAESVRTFFGVRGGKPTVTEWSNSDGGYTLYLGKRQSELYLRAYNKGAQSNMPEYKGVLRVELEVKNHMTVPVIAHMTGKSGVKQGIIAIVHKYLLDRGVLCNIATDNLPSLSYNPRVQSDRVKALRWLTDQVKPTVQRLIEWGYEDEVIESLGLPISAKGRAVESSDAPF